MMTLWLSMLGLLLFAVLFIAWPLWRHRRAAGAKAISGDELQYRLAENVRLYREHLAELDSSLASGRIDAEQFAQLKVELERNLLEDERSLRSAVPQTSSALGAKLAMVFFVIVLGGGIFLYQTLGRSDDLAVQTLQLEKSRLDLVDMQAGRNPDPARTQELIAAYKKQVEREPENEQYWFLLARSYMEINDFAQAVPAYQKVLELDPKASMVMAELAQAMFLRDGNTITPPVVDLAKRALTLDAKNVMASGLLGIDAFSRKSYKEAIQYWQKTVDLLGADSPAAQSLLGGIARAKEQFVEEGGDPAELANKSVYALKVSVALGENVKASPEQTVFIYARAWQGTPMPLAIARVKVSDLPATIILDESMAMSPMASLATASDVEVVARISNDGTAQTKPGDWQAKRGPVSMKSVPDIVELRINEQVTAE